MIKKNIKNAIILDDHLIFAETFSILLERLRLFLSIHSFNDEDSLIDFAVKNHQLPYYLFLDYYMKTSNSLHLINEIKRINKQTQIVIISSVTNPILINNILNYNISGIISKVSGTETIIECIKAIQRNERYVCPHIQSILEENKNNQTINFTARELEILQYFAQGNSILKTAEFTFLSKHTIVAHRRKMMAKAGCRSITELLAYARKIELI